MEVLRSFARHLTGVYRADKNWSKLVKFTDLTSGEILCLIRKLILSYLCKSLRGGSPIPYSYSTIQVTRSKSGRCNKVYFTKINEVITTLTHIYFNQLIITLTCFFFSFLLFIWISVFNTFSLNHDNICMYILVKLYNDYIRKPLVLSEKVVDRHVDWWFEAVCRVVLPARDPGDGAGGPQAGAGAVQVAVTEMSSHPSSPALVAVVVAVCPGEACVPALLQALHLHDEVHGQVGALPVSRLTPAMSSLSDSCG